MIWDLYKPHFVHASWDPSRAVAETLVRKDHKTSAWFQPGWIFCRLGPTQEVLSMSRLGDGASSQDISWSSDMLWESPWNFCVDRTSNKLWQWRHPSSTTLPQRDFETYNKRMYPSQTRPQTYAHTKELDQWACVGPRVESFKISQAPHEHPRNRTWISMEITDIPCIIRYSSRPLICWGVRYGAFFERSISFWKKTYVQSCPILKHAPQTPSIWFHWPKKLHIPYPKKAGLRTWKTFYPKAKRTISYHDNHPHPTAEPPHLDMARNLCLQGKCRRFFREPKRRLIDNDELQRFTVNS